MPISVKRIKLINLNHYRFINYTRKYNRLIEIGKKKNNKNEKVMENNLKKKKKTYSKCSRAHMRVKDLFGRSTRAKFITRSDLPKARRCRVIGYPAMYPVVFVFK